MNTYNGKLFGYELWILRRKEIWKYVRPSHTYDYISYVEIRMLPINVMAASCYTELHLPGIVYNTSSSIWLYGSSVSDIYGWP